MVGVSQESILAIRPLLLLYQDSWSLLQIKELDPVSIIPFKRSVDPDVKGQFVLIIPSSYLSCLLLCSKITTGQAL